MNKRKSPVVTSPWKIGVLVSLLIVASGGGAIYLVMRTFNLSWSWVNLEPGNYAFHLDQFMDQMLPQIALVLGLCIAGYLSISAAVKKYRAYLDSGLDYKQLIQSLHRVEDLDDESALKKLSSYPELKSFLGELRNSLKHRDTMIEQQKIDLEKHACDAEYATKVESDCKALIAVIREKISNGERRDLNLDLSTAELKDVATAIMEIPVRRESGCGDEEKARMAELHQNLREASDFITGRLEDISRDLVGSSQEAKNIEAQISALKQIVDPADTVGTSEKNIQSLEHISSGVTNIVRLSDELAELSEETRSIAINSALQAGSGEGTLADLIELAEGVKEIAKRSEQSAALYRAAGDELSDQVSTLHKMLRDTTANPEALITSTVNTLSSKTSLWVERIVVLSDKIKTLEKSYRVSFQTLEDRIGGYADLNREEDAAFEIEKTESPQMQTDSIVIQSSESFQFVQDGGNGGGEYEDNFSADIAAARKSSFAPDHADSDVPDNEVSESGIDGFIQERNIFESTQAVEDAYFANRPIEIQDQFDKIESNPVGSVSETELDRVERAAESYRDPEAANVDAPGSAPDAQKALDASNQQYIDVPGDSFCAARETEEEIVDLYTLGAVDYVAHHSEQQP